MDDRHPDQGEGQDTAEQDLGQADLCQPGLQDLRSEAGYLRAQFPASVEAATLARQACGLLLPLAGGRHHDLKLLVSELVTNSVRHADVDGDNTVWLDVAVGPDRIRLDVADSGSGFQAPELPEPGVPRVGGWGLALVNQLCDRWGTSDKGSHVWAELAGG